MLLSKNSQLLLRNKNIFETKKVFFFGNIKDDYPLYLKTIKTTINLKKYSDYIFLKNKNIKKINIYNDFLVSKNIIHQDDTIVYYWPKDKSEAKFQLMNLISFLAIDTKIFIVGNNSSGVKSAILIFKTWILLNKIDSAKHAILLAGVLIKNKTFVLEKFYKTHIWKKLSIQSLPGVFGYKKIDEGSKLLASTFLNTIRGEVLDIGCGTGFLAASILYYSPDAIVSLVDDDVSALNCSKLTLYSNNLTGKIIRSNLYSNISKKFDLIVSNPPFHSDLKVTLKFIKTIIHDSKYFLKKKGELRFVTNHNFNYYIILKKNFRKFNVLKQTARYKVYQAFLN